MFILSRLWRGGGGNSDHVSNNPLPLDRVKSGPWLVLPPMFDMFTGGLNVNKFNI